MAKFRKKTSYHDNFDSISVHNSRNCRCHHRWMDAENARFWLCCDRFVNNNAQCSKENLLAIVKTEQSFGLDRSGSQFPQKNRPECKLNEIMKFIKKKNAHVIFDCLYACNNTQCLSRKQFEANRVIDEPSIVIRLYGFFSSFYYPLDQSRASHHTLIELWHYEVQLAATYSRLANTRTAARAIDLGRMYVKKESHRGEKIWR